MSIRIEAVSKAYKGGGAHAVNDVTHRITSAMWRSDLCAIAVVAALRGGCPAGARDTLRPETC